MSINGFMLKARGMTPDDIYEIRELHERYFSDLEFPDFINKFLCAFVIEDEENEIVMAGGIQPIGEIVLVTNTDKSEVKIGRALIEARNICLFLGSKFNLDELVAFIRDNDAYARHLVRHGFYPRSLALGIKVPQWEKTTENKN
jgi:hypothetical protein